MAPLSCPACRKLQPCPLPDNCRRCGCELDQLRLISEAADQACQAARSQLLAGRGDQALALAEKSWQLRHQPASARLAFLAALLLKDFTAATTWHARGKSS
ncbi:MAG: hypothetical protein JXR89_10005 [Deltaproteobacteria bacterium]|nr:hypothetical protein [Deltaproteobacteria bacterium]